MGVRKNFCRGWQRCHFVYQIQAAIDAMHTGDHKTAYLVYNIKKMRHVAATVTKTLRWQK